MKNSFIHQRQPPIFNFYFISIYHRSGEFYNVDLKLKTFFCTKVPPTSTKLIIFLQLCTCEQMLDEMIDY